MWLEDFHAGFPTKEETELKCAFSLNYIMTNVDFDVNSL